MDLKHELTAEAHRLGFLLAGVTLPVPPPHSPVFERWLAAGHHAGMAYLAAERARLQAGEKLYAAGSFDQAQAQFEKLLATSSSGPLAGTAQLGLAASLEAQGKLDDAAKNYRAIMTAFADSTVATTAKFSLARTLEAQGKLNDALTYFSEVARSPQAGSLVSEASLHAAEIKIELAATNKPAGK